MEYITACESPLGEITLACDGESLTGLWFRGQKYDGTGRKAIREDSLPVFTAAREWLAAYFSGGKPAPGDLPLAPAGTDFRKLVWSFLCEIPYGERTTYREIARKTALRMGRPHMSAQAVGGAVGHNPISIIIPCHRVIGSNGSLTGYAGGLDRKIRLLEIEGSYSDIEVI